MPCYLTGSRIPALRQRYKVLTDRRIHHAPDCVGFEQRRICFHVALSPPVALPDADKLNILRRLDQFRQWQSLDDKRFCLVCGKIITGRRIQVEDGTHGNTTQRLSCPTDRCNSIPMDWVLPTEEILAVAETTISEERNIAPQMAANRDEEHGVTSRPKKLATHFKLVF
jgi:hypothetical protein